MKLPGDQFVYVNDDGTVRELAPDEIAYLNTDFKPTDGARPYIKRGFEGRDGWGRLRGFLHRGDVPPNIPIGKAPNAS